METLDLKYLTEAFLQNYRRRLHQAWEINAGDCFRWALLACKLHGGQLYSVSLMIEDLDFIIPGTFKPDGTHAFIKIDNKYYDAETTEGVDDWEQLPYFKRIDFSQYTDSWWYEVREHTSVRSFKRFWRPTLITSRADRKLLRKIKDGQDKPAT